MPKKPNPKKRYRMSPRVDPKLHKQFRAMASLLGQTIEERIEHLMREDVAANRDILQAEVLVAS